MHCVSAAIGDTYQTFTGPLNCFIYFRDQHLKVKQSDFVKKKVLNVIQYSYCAFMCHRNKKFICSHKCITNVFFFVFFYMRHILFVTVFSFFWYFTLFLRYTCFSVGDMKFNLFKTFVLLLFLLFLYYTCYMLYTIHHINWETFGLLISSITHK